MEIWIHRSNSICSWKTAFMMGAHIETDVSFSPRGDIITHHPGTTDPHSTLDELLEFMKTSPNLKCCLDIKQNNKRLVNLIMQQIHGYGLEDRIYITAFQKRLAFPPFNMEVGGDILIYAKKICPTIRTHLIAAFPFNLTGIVRKYNPDLISFGWLLDNRTSQLFFKWLVAPFINLRAQISELKSMGVKVLGGIMNDAKDLEYFTKLGVDGIMTDNAQIAIELINKSKIP